MHFFFQCIIKQFLDSVFVISRIIIKITISSIEIAFKNSYFSLINCTCQVVIRQFVIGQVVIGQVVIGQVVIGQFVIGQFVIG